MTTLSSDYKTIVDWATDAGAIQMVEILKRKNPLVEVLPFVPCNDGTGHKSKARTGYPEPTWRRLYGYVQPTKGTITPVRDTTGMLQDYGEVDYEEYELQGDDRDVWRMYEDFAHIEGMSNGMEDALWYGDASVDPEKFNGLAARYSTGNSAEAATAENIINGGGQSSTNTSIWLLGLGPRSLHGIFPKGSQAGLQAFNLGKQTKQEPGGNGLMEVLRSHYKWNAGLALPDWRCTGRYANIDVPSLRSTVDNMKALITGLIKLTEVVEPPPGGRQVLCANKTITTYLRIGILEKIAANLTWETVEGRKVMVFDEIPILRSDALVNTEAAVTFPS